MKVQGVIVTYVLLPVISLLLAAVVFVLNKQNKLISNKELIIFALLSSLIIAIPGLLTITGTAFMPGFYFITQLSFLVIGYFYTRRISHYFASGNLLYDRSMVILTSLLILCFGSFLFSLVFNFLGDFQYGLMASTCTYTLVLPVLFRWSQEALIDIPSEIYKVWTYSRNYEETIFTSETIDRIIVLELELSKKPEDSEYVKVKAKAPVNFNFGEWFQMFIHDHNIKYSESPVMYQKEDGQLYGWIFYIRPDLIKGKKYIDFEKSIEENELTDNLTIVCKRVEYNNQ
jgi:hypothetical protein